MRRTAGLLSIALGGAAMVAAAPAAQAAAFDPCAATTQGRLLYPVGSAVHLVFALSSGYASNEVVVTQCVKLGRFWTKQAETSGRAGYAGFAEPGKKREGDGKSPTGSFTLTQAFGRENPRTHLPYRTLRDSGDCWSATSGTGYNEYYAGTCRPADEDLSATMQRGPYHQAVVIDYNRPNAVAGNGSAIFFHVGGTTSTAGCIAIPESNLTGMMRTLAPYDRMIMGPQSVIFRS
jgi:L,D-peptidoglycan transpeptidase YkuD (ErfK/YbiS/YcfS/YnhG family)